MLMSQRNKDYSQRNSLLVILSDSYSDKYDDGRHNNDNIIIKYKKVFMPTREKSKISLNQFR